MITYRHSAMSACLCGLLVTSSCAAPPLARDSVEEAEAAATTTADDQAYILDQEKKGASLLNDARGHVASNLDVYEFAKGLAGSDDKVGSEISAALKDLLHSDDYGGQSTKVALDGARRLAVASTLVEGAMARAGLSKELASHYGEFLETLRSMEDPTDKTPHAVLDSAVALAAAMAEQTKSDAWARIRDSIAMTARDVNICNGVTIAVVIIAFVVVVITAIAAVATGGAAAIGIVGSSATGGGLTLSLSRVPGWVTVIAATALGVAALSSVLYGWACPTFTGARSVTSDPAATDASRCPSPVLEPRADARWTAATPSPMRRGGGIAEFGTMTRGAWSAWSDSATLPPLSIAGYAEADDSGDRTGGGTLEGVLETAVEVSQPVFRFLLRDTRAQTGTHALGGSTAQADANIHMSITDSRGASICTRNWTLVSNRNHSGTRSDVFPAATTFPTHLVQCIADAPLRAGTYRVRVRAGARATTDGGSAYSVLHTTVAGAAVMRCY